MNINWDQIGNLTESVDWITQEGRHRLVVESVTKGSSRKHGETIDATFYVESSTAYPAGKKLQKRFFVCKPEENGGTYQLVDLRKFVGAALGIDDPGQAAGAAKMLYDNQASQPARGVVVDCVSISESKENRTFTNLNFLNVAGQSPETISAMRQKVESGHFEDMFGAVAEPQAEKPEQMPEQEAPTPSGGSLLGGILGK